MAMEWKFNLSKLRGFELEIKRGASGLLRPVFKKWGVRYLAWTRKLFREKSEGGTAESVKWPKLKPSTLTYRRVTGMNLRTTRGGKLRGAKAQARLKGKYYESIFRGNIKILRDMGILFRALTIGAPGNLWKWLKNGVMVGFGGPTRHPRGKATIRDIAVFHDKGKGRLPKRQILHKPNKEIIDYMMNALSKELNRLGKKGIKSFG